MSIDWDDYEAYDPGTDGPPNALPRKEARKAFLRCMGTKSTRIEMLARLVKANGGHLGTDDMAIQNLNDWFFISVEADPVEPGRLRAEWYSVCHDVALFLGEVMIKRSPGLHWEFFTWGKTNVAYQRQVIMGLGAEDPKFHTNINIDRMVATYAHQIIEAKGSIPRYGTIDVRGTQVDVDAVAARNRSQEIDTEAFYHWLQMAAQRAEGC